MKQDLNFKSMIYSLIFPTFICLVSGIPAILLSFSEMKMLTCGCYFSFLSGGLTPLIITIITKTDTSNYLKNRLFTFLLSVIIVAIAMLMNVVLNTIYIAWITLFLSDVLLTAYYILKARSHLERFVICMSNPILYFTICLVCFGYDLHVAFS